MAGILAGLAARLTGHAVPEIAPVLTDAAEVSTGLHLLLGWPGFLLLAGLLGLIAGRVAGTRPRIVVVALATTLPLVTPSARGLARESAAILLVAETLRWAIFGLALGDFLPLAAGSPGTSPAG